MVLVGPAAEWVLHARRHVLLVGAVREALSEFKLLILRF